MAFKEIQNRRAFPPGSTAQRIISNLPDFIRKFESRGSISGRGEWAAPKDLLPIGNTLSLRLEAAQYCIGVMDSDLGGQ